MTDPGKTMIFQFKNKIYFGYPSTGHTYPSNFLVFNLDSMRPSYYDWGLDITAFCQDDTNDRILAADSSGYFWMLEDHN